MRLLPLLTVVLSACHAHFDLPMTATTLAAEDSGDALAAYLSQRDASPSVCDVTAKTPHVSHIGESARDALVRSLLDGSVSPTRWGACVELILAQKDRRMLDALARPYQKLITNSDLETKPRVAERLAVLHRLYLERTNGLDASPEQLQPMIEDLRAALARPKSFGPIGQRFGQELVATIDLEHGLWEGHPVDLRQLEALEAQRNEAVLRRFSQRLPDASLREAARRGVVRVHIAASAFSEVTSNAAAVEARVLRDGYNAISAQGHSGAVSTSFTGRQRTIRVEPHTWDQTATVLAVDPTQEGLTVLPELQLRGAFWARFGDVSQPVTLCAPPQELDVSPCLLASQVTVDNPLAYLDASGALRFKDDASLRAIMELAASPDFSISARIASAPPMTLHWPLQFLRPENLVFQGPAAGAQGPRLDVRAAYTASGRWVFDVTSPRGHYFSVVENPDIQGYRVASIGAPGENGATGYAGSAGYSGGQCQNGGNGGPGGPGGNGGPGGSGGDVTVTFTCAGAYCRDALALLQAIVSSQGGSGGLAGAGGPGGAGGMGGMSRAPTTHSDSNGYIVTDDYGCSAGASGSAGYPGSNGYPGPAGRAGRVAFQLAPSVL